MAGWIGCFLEGVTATDGTLALDLINHVGPIPGHYLSTAHTREFWRQERWLPQAADLEAYPVWNRTGKKDALAPAEERMEDILATHKPPPLTPDQEQSIEDILGEARDYYRDKGLITGREWSAYTETLNSGRQSASSLQTTRITCGRVAVSGARPPARFLDPPPHRHPRHEADPGASSKQYSKVHPR